MTSASAFPLELYHAVIHETALEKDRAALHAFSLTCRSFRRISQVHLFTEVSYCLSRLIELEDYQNNGHSSSSIELSTSLESAHPTPGLAAVECRSRSRFLSILTSNPELGGYIRRLRITYSTVLDFSAHDVNAGIERLPEIIAKFTNLGHLEIVGGAAGPFPGSIAY